MTWVKLRCFLLVFFSFIAGNLVSSGQQSRPNVSVILFSFIAGNLVSSGQYSRLNVSVILGVGVGLFSRSFEPLYLKNCWTYQNEHGSIRSSSAPFFELTPMFYDQRMLLDFVRRLLSKLFLLFVKMLMKYSTY